MEYLLADRPAHVRAALEMHAGLPPPPDILEPFDPPDADDEDSLETMDVDVNVIEVCPPRPFLMEALLDQVGPNSSSINLNYCYWVKAEDILEMLSKTSASLKHLHLIQCQLDRNCIEAIMDLELESLSISFDINWKVYFWNRRENRNFYMPPCFKELRNFTVFFNYARQFPSYSTVRVLYSEVFKYCREVESLTLIASPEYAHAGINQFRPRPSLPARRKLLPKVSTLVLDLSNYDDLEDDLRLLFTDIFNDQHIPLKYGCFGGTVAEEKIFRNNYLLPHPPIMKNDKTLIFRKNFYAANAATRPYKELYSSILRETRFQNIFLSESLFGLETQTDLETGLARNGQYIKKIHLQFLAVEQVNFYLLRMARKGNRVQILDLSMVTIADGDRTLLLSKFFEILPKFTDLEVLSLSAHFFQRYHRITGSYCPSAKKIGIFEKMAENNEQIKELRITYPFCFYNGDLDSLTNIHAGDLNDISMLKNLKILTLKNITPLTNEAFHLSSITQHCEQLEELYLSNLYLPKAQDYKLRRFLFNAKNIKTLSLSFSTEMVISNSFFTELFKCPKLERFSMGRNAIMGPEKLPTFRRLLYRVKTLYALVVKEPFRLKEPQRLEMVNIFRQFSNERIGFFVDTGIFKIPYLTPEVHMDLYD